MAHSRPNRILHKVFIGLMLACVLIINIKPISNVKAQSDMEPGDLPQKQTLSAFDELLDYPSISLQNASGDIDVSFGTAGQVVQSVDALSRSTQRKNYDIAQESSNGNIFVAVEESNTINNYISVYKYDSDGQLLTVFIHDVTEYSGFSVRSIAVQNNGKIVLGGEYDTNSAEGVFDNALILFRFNSDGTIDTTFNGGVFVYHIGYYSEYLSDILVQPDGKIVILGDYDVASGVALIRINENGTLDANFGNDDGLVKTSDLGIPDGTLISTEVALQDDGKLLVVSNNIGGYSFYIFRVNINGSLDSTFGNGTGYVNLNPDYEDAPYSIVAQPDGKIVVVGETDDYASRKESIVLYRLLENGNVDPTFGQSGYITTVIPDFLESKGFDVVVQGDYKLVVSGTTGSEFAVVRYNIDGTIDQNFGNSGYVVYDFGETVEEGTHIFIQNDKKVIVGGRLSNGFGLIRLNNSFDVIDPTPPYWSDPVGSKLYGFQVADGTARLYWEKAIDPESAVSYKLRNGGAEFATIACNPTIATYTVNNIDTSFDCTADISGLVKGSDYGFTLQPINDAGLLGSEDQVNNLMLSTLDFISIQDLKLAFEDPTGPVAQAIMANGDFVTEGMALTEVDKYDNTLYKMVSLVDLYLSIRTLVKKGLVLFLAGLLENYSIGVWGAYILGNDDTFYILAATDSSTLSTSLISAEFSPLFGTIPVGKPGYIVGRMQSHQVADPKYGIQTLYFFEPKPQTKYNINWENYQFSIGSSIYGSQTITSFSDLFCTSDYPEGEVGYKEKVSLIGQVKSRWQDGASVYLELLNVDGPKCRSFTFVPPDNYRYDFFRKEFLLVKIDPLTMDIPAENSIIEINGDLSFSYDKTQMISNLIVDTTTDGNTHIIRGQHVPIGIYDIIPDWHEPDVAAVLNSPNDLHVYDNAGNHVGAVYDEFGQVVAYENEMPGAIHIGGGSIEPEILILPNVDVDNLNLNVVGTASGTFDLFLNATQQNGAIEHDLKFSGVAFSATSTASLSMGSNSTFVLELDNNSDGIVDQIIEPNEHSIGGDETTLDLRMQQTASASSVEVGQTFTYILEITNAGPLDATTSPGVLVSDQLPPEVAYQNYSASQGSCMNNAALHKIECSMGEIASGQNATVTVNVTATTVGNAINTANVSSAETDYDQRNNTDEIAVLVTEPSGGVVIVTNTNDSGAGSLRQAIADSNPGGTITFSQSLSGKTIALNSTLALDRNITIDGSSLSPHINISGGNNTRVFFIDSGMSITINHVNIIGGSTNNGGAILIYYGSELTVSDSILDDNYATNYGGGIYNAGGVVNVYRSMFINNTAGNNQPADGGGAIYNAKWYSDTCGAIVVTESSFINNNAKYGGGIYNYFECTATIIDSTFSNNIAIYGGGIYNQGAIAITNSTFFGNSAYNIGGGIYNNDSLDILNSTFSQNSSSIDSGIFNTSDGTLSLRNSVLASSLHSKPDCYNQASDVISINQNTLIQTNGPSGHMCGMPAIIADPMLGTLADNGGPTQTVALLTGSPAIDAGDDIICPSSDQRGVARPQGAQCDIGAFETIAPTFTDVSTGYWSWDYVERLYNAGVTGGCSTTPLSYCPENSVTRAQMAIFLEKGVHYPFPFAPLNLSPTFSDTTDHWAEDWIEALRSDGITGGCGTNLYCPEDPVTRAQMAVFLLKSKYGSGYTPPAVGASTGFADVPTTHWAAAWIKQLAAEGITGGCGTGTYCPESPVTRAQMAVFLVRTFGLP